MDGHPADMGNLHRPDLAWEDLDLGVLRYVEFYCDSCEIWLSRFPPWFLWFDPFDPHVFWLKATFCCLKKQNFYR
jgi:hypothetical protein